MKMFVVLEQTSDGYNQAHDRNKTYKTLAMAIYHGVTPDGGQLPQVIDRTADTAVVKCDGRTFVVVNVGDFAIQLAGACQGSGY